jgi:hypothetical protein
MRSIGPYYLHLPLHKNVILVRKDPLIIKNVAVAKPYNHDLINDED